MTRAFAHYLDYGTTTLALASALANTSVHAGVLAASVDAIVVGVHRGSFVRTMISGTAIMVMTIWISNQVVELQMRLAQETGPACGLLWRTRRWGRRRGGRCGCTGGWLPSDP